MKKLFTMLFVALVCVSTAFAQAPEAFKYQAVLRSSDGTVIAGRKVNLRIAILKGINAGQPGPSVYTETQEATTSNLGLVNLEVGRGTVVSGNFATINWGADSYFIQVELDENGGTNYKVLGYSQLLSVPYALQSKMAADISVTSPTLNAETTARQTNDARLEALIGAERGSRDSAITAERRVRDSIIELLKQGNNDDDVHETLSNMIKTEAAERKLDVGLLQRQIDTNKTRDQQLDLRFRNDSVLVRSMMNSANNALSARLMADSANKQTQISNNLSRFMADSAFTIAKLRADSVALAAQATAETNRALAAEAAIQTQVTNNLSRFSADSASKQTQLNNNLSRFAADSIAKNTAISNLTARHAADSIAKNTAIAGVQTQVTNNLSRFVADSIARNGAATGLQGQITNNLNRFTADSAAKNTAISNLTARHAADSIAKNTAIAGVQTQVTNNLSRFTADSVAKNTAIAGVQTQVTNNLSRFAADSVAKNTAISNLTARHAADSIAKNTAIAGVQTQVTNNLSRFAADSIAKNTAISNLTARHAADSIAKNTAIAGVQTQVTNNLSRFTADSASKQTQITNNLSRFTSDSATKATAIAALQANGSVTSARIADSTITTADISATAAIPYSKLSLTNSIANADLQANSVTTSKVANGTVTTSKLADSAVSGLKLLTRAVTPTHIDPAGATSGDVLSYNGTAVVWTAASGGSLTLPYSQSASASSPLFALTQTGSSNAATLSISNSGSTSSILNLSGNHIGNGLAIQLTNASNGGRGIDVTQSGVGPGVFATSAGGNAVWGITSSISAAGVIGDNTFGEAVVGRNRGGNGVGAVVGRNDSSGYGVRGFNTKNGYGVLGQAGISGGTGTAGRFENVNAANTSDALQVVTNSAGNAARFTGNVVVNGNLTVSGTVAKGGGSFKIDHPLDPENKVLFHSFVESPEMKNIYDGVATLDAKGEAVVELPNWFQALNGDFRYQLTAVGAPGPGLYIAEKVLDNHFRIAGGTPGMEVSWQVTGIRHDPYAKKHRIQVEVDKTPEERGSYLHPDAYGIQTGSIPMEASKSSDLRVAPRLQSGSDAPSVTKPARGNDK